MRVAKLVKTLLSGIVLKIDHAVASVAVFELLALLASALSSKAGWCSNLLDVVLAVVNVDVFFYLMTAVLVSYLILGVLLFPMWGFIGLRGLFYLAEYHILSACAMLIVALYINLKYHLSVSACMCELFLYSDLEIFCVINVDLLANIGVLLVLILTAIVLTFGVEYMSREAFSYSVLATLTAFSSSIVWFMLSYDFGLMSIFWELAGLFSILLVDTFYSRIRTTQAVTRTYSIGRFSDYWLFLAMSEIAGTFDTESLAAVFGTVRAYSASMVSVTATVYDSTALNMLAVCIFVAASCKCAQIVLFVWLPDAMEAPTPASALIHSSTLVVMGVFMLLRMSPVFKHAGDVLAAAMVVGAVTVVYGATSAIRTSDLKKAVAYSTISQIGYLYCGCGLLALKETLIYLAVHAVCKAMLFVFVGYAVHVFRTTSLRKMGGLYYLAPDIALCVCVLCAILAGAPYTIGFVAKELIVSHLFSVYSPIMCFVCFCWSVAFICTPVYLYRICVLPFFGRPRGTSGVFKRNAALKQRMRHFALGSFDLDELDSPLQFFGYHSRSMLITGKVTSILHALAILFVLYSGEFFILLVSGVFNTSSTLLSGSGEMAGVFAVSSYSLSAFSTLKEIQVLILSLLLTVTLYVYTSAVKRNRSSWLVASLALLALSALLVVSLATKLYLYAELC